MSVTELEKHYGKPYNRAYFEIKELFLQNGFEWIQGSTYVTHNGNLSNLFQLITILSKIEWFKKSVKDIRGFKIEDWSDFTELVKNS